MFPPAQLGDEQTGTIATTMKLTYEVCQAPDWRASGRTRLPTSVSPRYLEVVSRLEAIVEDLKTLPIEKLEAAGELIRRLKPVSQEERKAILARTFGSLSQDDADAMLKAIEEGCERIDEQRW
jgi:hypothetical protein